jgi:N-acetylneuraminic acid mutarotase
VFYDEARERVMVANGGAVDSRRNSTLFNDLWSFDGTAWTPLAPSGDPIAGTRVAVDDQRRVYSLGGFNDTAGIGVLRSLENGRWRRVGVHPSGVIAEGGFVFDVARKRFVVFGGSGEGRTLPDTWEYDGTRWSKSGAASPPARSVHVMVYDVRRKKTVVFGGIGVRRGEDRAPIFADTWEFDGTTWSQVHVSGPAPRLGAGATYDSKRGVVLVFGGSNHDGVFNDLWSWDGTSWKKLAEGGPEPRLMGYIAYDKKRDRVVLFGGRRGVPVNADLSDTWEWNGAAWRRIGE